MGCSKLTSEDQIHIFYTENSKKINLDVFNDHGDARIVVHKVKVEKESIDMHIVSYLGYLIGRNGTQDYRYVIISRDRDYDKIIDFLYGETGVSVERIPSIDPAAAKKQEQNRKRRARGGRKASASTAARSGENKRQGEPAKAEKPEEAVSSSGRKTAEKNKSGQRERRSGSSRGAGREHRQSERNASARAKADEGQKIFFGSLANRVPEDKTDKAAQKSVTPASSVKASSSDIKTRMNQDIQKKLSSAGMPAEVVNHVASVAVKNAGEENGKQMTYQAIIKQYGMVKGLNIYRHVKKMIP